MKKLWRSCKLNAHPSVLAYFLMSLAVGWFKESILTFMIILGHEYSHALVAWGLGYDVRGITLYPFGAFVDVRDFGMKPIWRDFLVVLAGPLSHLWLHLVGLGLMSFLGEHSYGVYVHLNQGILFLNLLPIWPLDGSKLVMLLASYLLDYLVVLKCQIWWSLVVLACFMQFTFQMGTILLYAYLLMQIWDYSRHFYYYYLAWLGGRLAGCPYKRTRLAQPFELRRPWHQFYLVNGHLMDEKSFIQTQFFVDKKNRKC